MENVLLSSEIEFYIDSCKPTNLRDIGTQSWLDWHERLQKLNQQSLLEASAMREESVKESFIALDKTRTLVHEAILINVWKQKLLPILLKLDPEPETTFIAYSVLYHEAVAVNLLSLILFHPDSCESLGDAIADLLDYAYGCLGQLLVIQIEEGSGRETGGGEISRQKEEIAFEVGINCLGIVRYISENIDRISVGISSRIYGVHDVPVMLVQVLLKHPWIRGGKIYKNGKWMENKNPAQLCQAEAQIWLTLRHLLLDKACFEHYPITESRRCQLMKLLPLITPTLLDQVAPLVELNHWLCQLSVSELPSAPPKPLLLEVVLQIREAIVAQGEKKWRKIAKEQLDVVFCTDKDVLQNAAQRLAAAYNTDFLEKFDAENEEICKVCDKVAAQRCSKCKAAWYCSRNCQVKDWQDHKDSCQ